MLRIRLRRTGKKHQPHYRIVVAEHTAPIAGKFVAQLGHYNPRSKELVLNAEATTTWLNHGAQPSNRMSRLLAAQGVKHKLIQIHVFPERKAKKAEPEAASPSPAAPAVDTPVVDTEPSKEGAPATEAPAAEAAVDTPSEPAASAPESESSTS